MLRECGMDVDQVALGNKQAGAKIANFIAYDTDETGTPCVCVCIPLLPTDNTAHRTTRARPRRVATRDYALRRTNVAYVHFRVFPGTGCNGNDLADIVKTFC